MSLQDMTVDEVIASIHNALEQELQKQHPISPSYHSGHVALSYKIGAEAERERIIKLMEEEVRYDFPPIIEMSLDSFIKLIKGEQK